MERVTLYIPEHDDGGSSPSGFTITEKTVEYCPSKRYLDITGACSLDMDELDFARLEQIAGYTKDHGVPVLVEQVSRSLERIKELLKEGSVWCGLHGVVLDPSDRPCWQNTVDFYEAVLAAYRGLSAPAAKKAQVTLYVPHQSDSPSSGDGFSIEERVVEYDPSQRYLDILGDYAFDVEDLDFSRLEQIAGYTRDHGVPVLAQEIHTKRHRIGELLRGKILQGSGGLSFVTMDPKDKPYWQNTAEFYDRVLAAYGFPSYQAPTMSQEADRAWLLQGIPLRR